MTRSRRVSLVATAAVLVGAGVGLGHPGGGVPDPAAWAALAETPPGPFALAGFLVPLGGGRALLVPSDPACPFCRPGSLGVEVEPARALPATRAAVVVRGRFVPGAPGARPRLTDATAAPARPADLAAGLAAAP